jgi:hypothetical protein
MRAALMSIEKAFMTYSEGMTRGTHNARAREVGGCSRR